MISKPFSSLTSPPNFFTPRYFGLESRPFFVDPAVFFVAQRLNVKLNPPPVISKFKGNRYINKASFIEITKAQFSTNGNFTTSRAVYRSICNQLIDIQSSTK